MADDFKGWSLVPAQSDVAGWKLEPAAAPAKPKDWRPGLAAKYAEQDRNANQAFRSMLGAADLGDIGKRGASAIGALLGRTYDPETTNFAGQSEAHFGELYGENLETLRGTFNKAEKERPGSAFVGKLVPYVAAGPMSVARAGIMGAFGGAGESESDSALGVASDALTEGALTAGGQKLGNALGAGYRYAAPKGRQLLEALASKVRGAEVAGMEKAAAKVAKSINSQTGSARSAVQSASRDLEVIDRLAADDTVAPELRAELDAFRTSDKGAALKAKVGKGKLRYGPERVAEMESEDAALAALKETADADTAAAYSAEMDTPFKTHVVPRLKMYAGRAVPPLVAGAIGGGVGGLPGAALGGLLGFGTSAVLGSPGTAIANMMRSPGFRKMGWNALRKTVSGAGEVADPVARLLAAMGERGGAGVGAEFGESARQSSLADLLRNKGNK